MAAEVEWCWRPVGPGEVPYLVAVGALLRAYRREARWTQVELARRARRTAQRATTRPSLRTVQHIERGERRSRYSTLARLARALGKDLGRDPADILFEFVRAAGPTLAPERGKFDLSAYRGRRRPFLDPSTGEHIGFEGVPKAGSSG